MCEGLLVLSVRDCLVFYLRGCLVYCVRVRYPCLQRRPGLLCEGLVCVYCVRVSCPGLVCEGIVRVSCVRDRCPCLLYEGVCCVVFQCLLCKVL